MRAPPSIQVLRLSAAMMPSGMPSSDGDEHRRQRQLDGGREKVAQIVGDGAARADRVAEVALQQAAHVDAVLHDDRFVQPQLLAIGGDLFLARVGTQRRGRRIRRHQLRQKKGQAAKRRNDEDQPAQPAQMKAAIGGIEIELSDWVRLKA
jgi:hypothetical protein